MSINKNMIAVGCLGLTFAGSASGQDEFDFYALSIQWGAAPSIERVEGYQVQMRRADEEYTTVYQGDAQETWQPLPDYVVGEQVCAQVRSYRSATMSEVDSQSGQLQVSEYREACLELMSDDNVLDSSLSPIEGLSMSVVGAFDDNNLLADSTEDAAEEVSTEDEASTLSFRSSNLDMKAPLDVVLTTDRVPDATRYLWEVNGEDFGGGGGSSLRLDNLDSNTYEVVMTAFDNDEELTMLSTTIEVFDNAPPVCTIQDIAQTNQIEYRAKCRDPEGGALRYEWTVNGEVLRTEAYRIGVDLTQFAEPPIVSLVSTDNQGNQSEITHAN